MNSIIDRITKWEDIVIRLEESLIGFANLVIVFVIFLNVVGRLTPIPMPYGLNEFARYVVPLIVFIGSATAIRERSHITAGSMENIFKSEKKHAYAKLVTNMIAMVFCIFFFIWCCQEWLNTMQFGEVTMQLAIPMVGIQSFLPIGSFLMVAHYFLLIARAMQAIKVKDYSSVFPNRADLDPEF